MEARAASRGKQTEHYLGALVKLAEGQDGSALRREGTVLLDSLDGIYIALLPASRIPAMANSQQVVAMEAHQRSSLNMDVTHITTGADKVQAGTTTTATTIPAYTGKGVVVGISDSNFDYTHPMFRDANGNLRIKKAWDFFAPNSNGYGGLGTIYTTQEEMLAAQGSKVAQSTHGTHVMGIAAGSPWTAKTFDGQEMTYRGLAYEADIVAATAYLSTRNDDLDKLLAEKVKGLLYDDAYLQELKDKKVEINNIIELLSMKTAFDYAQEHNMPCVVNCSWGGPCHLTDRRAVDNEFITKLTGPGRILVAGTGNDGDDNLYLEKPANEYEWQPDVDVRTADPKFSLHCDGEFEFGVEIFTEEFDEAGHVNKQFETNPLIKSEDIRMKGDKDESYCMGTWINKEGKEEKVTLSFYYVKGVTSGYDYAIQLEMPEEFFKEKFFFANITFCSNSDMRLMGTANNIHFGDVYEFVNPYTIKWPGEADAAIAVGATSHRNYVTNIHGESVSASGNLYPEGRIVNWSSCGPTLDGRMKPEVTAPGYNIISARSKLYTGNAKEWEEESEMVIARNIYDGEEREMVSLSGTSMAAPVMTGIVALWLQAKPDLTREEIIATLSRTAKKLDPNKTYPNRIYGYGEVDAYAGLLDILGLPTSIPTLSQKLVGVSLQGRTLRIEGITEPTTVNVYTLNGQKVFSAQTDDGIVNLPSLPAAVYAVQCGTLGSSLIRM